MAGVGHRRLCGSRGDVIRAGTWRKGKIYRSCLTLIHLSFHNCNNWNTDGCSFMELKKSVRKSEIGKWQPTAAFSLQTHPNLIMKSLNMQKRLKWCNEPPLPSLSYYQLVAAPPIYSPFTNYFKGAPRYHNISFVNISVYISKRYLFCEQVQYPLKN